MFDSVSNQVGPFGVLAAPTTPTTHSFLSALTGGGDSRLLVNAVTGRNKYLCPATPAPDVVCVSSCTASPITTSGFARAAANFEWIADAASPIEREGRRAALRREIEAAVLAQYDIADLADVLLCPSGTDAVQVVARMIAAEAPHHPVTAILPAASETGTGVPLASAGLAFDGPAAADTTAQTARVLTVALRDSAGEPRPTDEVNAAYRAAVGAVRGRAVIYLTHGTKTGLVAPGEPPDGADVVVDACQARIEPATMRGYLRRGWPVVITGSKFFGGPAFSGAVLLPRERWRAPICSAPDHTAGPASLGMLLRWVAAIDAMEAFRSAQPAMAGFLRTQAAMIARGLAANSALIPVGGLASATTGHDDQSWSDLPSIFTFAVRDPADCHRCLTASELRPLYERLARRNVLLGQPVDLGPFGGLRIAIGARDVLEPDHHGLDRVFQALADATKGER